MSNTKGIVIAVIMAIALFGTGAAAQITGALTATMGWVLGGLTALCIIIGFILAGFGK